MSSQGQKTIVPWAGRCESRAEPSIVSLRQQLHNRDSLVQYRRSLWGDAAKVHYSNGHNIFIEYVVIRRIEQRRGGRAKEDWEEDWGPLGFRGLTPSPRVSHGNNLCVPVLGHVEPEIIVSN